MEFQLITLIPVAVFLAALILMALEVFEKALIALGGGLILTLLGFLTPHEALGAVNFETIILLLSMMILAEISRESGIFAWMNVKLVSITRGNPLLIAIIFSLITAIFSAFLDNVSTIIIMVPITIELMRGLGRDPKPIILQEIIMSNLGGTLTLIGDPTNILIGGAGELSFNDFIVNLWAPVTASVIVLSGIFIVRSWSHLKPISANMKNLLLSMVLLKKLQYKFLSREINYAFIFKSIGAILLTLIGFVLQAYLQLPVHVIALTGAIVLAIITSKNINLHKTLHGVEWATLLFFAGLFIMVGAIEKTGILSEVSRIIVENSSDFGMVVLMVLWVSAFISMALDNVAFVTVMIPVILGIQTQLPGEPNITLLWWALSMGAVMGGNGTIIGAAANVVGIDIARKHGIKITFAEHFKTAFPLTIVALIISTAYLLYRLNT